MNTSSTLHILNSSPSQITMSEFAKRFAKTDSLIFTGDACYQVSLLDESIIKQLPKMFILEADAEQRGISLEPFQAFMDCIDMQGFVNLSLNHQAIIHW